MNFDWKIALFAVSLVKDFVLVLGILLIKFNDMKHMGDDLIEIKKGIKGITNKINKLEKNHAAMQAVCTERHKDNK